MILCPSRSTKLWLLPMMKGKLVKNDVRHSTFDLYVSYDKSFSNAVIGFCILVVSFFVYYVLAVSNLEDAHPSAANIVVIADIFLIFAAIYLMAQLLRCVLMILWYSRSLKAMEISVNYLEREFSGKLENYQKPGELPVAVSLLVILFGIFLVILGPPFLIIPLIKNFVH